MSQLFPSQFSNRIPSADTLCIALIKAFRKIKEREQLSWWPFPSERWVQAMSILQILLDRAMSRQFCYEVWSLLGRSVLEEALGADVGFFMCLLHVQEHIHLPAVPLPTQSPCMLRSCCQSICAAQEAKRLGRELI